MAHPPHRGFTMILTNNSQGINREMFASRIAFLKHSFPRDFAQFSHLWVVLRDAFFLLPDERLFGLPRVKENSGIPFRPE